MAGGWKPMYGEEFDRTLETMPTLFTATMMCEALGNRFPVRVISWYLKRLFEERKLSLEPRKNGNNSNVYRKP